jgi:hypothetical protein
MWILADTSIDGPVTFFSTQNESYHFVWYDSSMSCATPFSVTHFGLKLVFCFTYYLMFLYNKKYIINLFQIL